MPAFVMIGRDGPDGGARRSEHHSAHVEHVTKLNEAGRIVLAGPIKSDDGATSVGAVIVFEAADLEAARAVVEQDPYVQAGVFAELSVQPFRQVFPEPS